MRSLLQLLFLLGILNFFVFWFAALYLGGDALSGRVLNGHYFLSNHGHLHEVSARVFAYSKWHTLTVLVTHPVAILSAWLLARDARDKAN